MPPSDRRTATLTPSTGEARLAQESGPRIARIAGRKRKSVRIQVEGNGNTESIELPMSAVRALADVLQQLAQGNAVTLLSSEAELTTQQAAGLLNVSRPFLVRLLDEGQIPSRKVGTHRRVRARDVQVWKERTDRARLRALAELQAQAQELNMGY